MLIISKLLMFSTAITSRPQLLQLRGGIFQISCRSCLDRLGRPATEDHRRVYAAEPEAVREYISTSLLRASGPTRSRPSPSGSGSVRLSVGGNTPSRKARTENTASRRPAAPAGAPSPISSTRSPGPVRRRTPCASPPAHRHPRPASRLHAH